MIEHAGTPLVLVLNDWHIEGGQVYGLTDEAPTKRYITARIDPHNAEQRPTRGGRVYCVGEVVCVLSRPLGQLQ